MGTKDYNEEERLFLVFHVKLIRASGGKITVRINELAKQCGISSASLRRWEHRFDEKGAGELHRQSRSDRGTSRANCKWVVEFALKALKKRPAPSHNQVYRMLLKEVDGQNADFCKNCAYAASCERAGIGIRLGSRHSINRIASCAKSTKAQKTK